MIEAGWELPAGEHLRGVAEILAAGPGPEERHRLRQAEAAAEAKRTEAKDAVRDAADSADAMVFVARVNGMVAHNPLAAADAPRDREAASRRRQAIEVLKPLGLADVVTGGNSGAVLDVNLGILEPAPDLAQRARMDYEYEAARAEVEASSRRRAVDRYRERLDERYRARFR
jgi:hypothetical protein